MFTKFSLLVEVSDDTQSCAVSRGGETACVTMREQPLIDAAHSWIGQNSGEAIRPNRPVVASVVRVYRLYFVYNSETSPVRRYEKSYKFGYRRGARALTSFSFRTKLRSYCRRLCAPCL